MCDVECVISVVGEAAGEEEEGAAGCNDKNKNPTIECGEKSWLGCESKRPGTQESRFYGKVR